MVRDLFPSIQRTMIPAGTIHFYQPFIRVTYINLPEERSDSSQHPTKIGPSFEGQCFQHPYTPSSRMGWIGSRLLIIENSIQTYSSSSISKSIFYSPHMYLLALLRIQCYYHWIEHAGYRYRHKHKYKYSTEDLNLV